MRSFTVTALIAAGLSGVAAPALAAPAAVPAVHATPAPGHPQPEPRQQAEPRRYPQPEPRQQAEPRQHQQPDPHQQPARAAYVLNMTGQAAHWQVVPGQLEVVRWTLINAGTRRLDHVHLIMSVPTGWVVRDGEGCEHRGAYLGCELGSLEPGRNAAVVVPLVAQKPFGAVRLTAWSRATAGRLTIPGPTTSFRVFVVAHH